MIRIDERYYVWFFFGTIFIYLLFQIDDGKKSDEDDSDDNAREEDVQLVSCIFEMEEQQSSSSINGFHTHAQLASIRSSLKKPIQLSNRFSEWFSKLIQEYYETDRLKDSKRKQMINFCDDLQQFLRKQLELPELQLKLFGSVNSGFGSENCDLDICIVDPKNDSVFWKIVIIDFLIFLRILIMLLNVEKY